MSPVKFNSQAQPKTLRAEVKFHLPYSSYEFNGVQNMLPCCDQRGEEVPDGGPREIKKDTDTDSLRKSGGQVGHCPLMERQ